MITMRRLYREWPHHVAVTAKAHRDHHETMRSISRELSVAPRTYSFRRGNIEYIVFCFAKSNHARMFCRQFGGEPIV